MSEEWFLMGGNELDSLQFSPNLLAALGLNLWTTNNLGTGNELNMDEQQLVENNGNILDCQQPLESLLERPSDNSSPSSSEEQNKETNENVEAETSSDGRTKPSCDRCVSRGIPCEYRESKRKQKTEESSRKKTKPSPEESSHPSFFHKTPSLTKSNTIDFYFAVNWILTTVNKEELRKLILQDQDETNQEIKLEMEAFFYSAKSVVEQFLGRSEISNDSALNCRKKLALINKAPSLVVSSAYLNLAIVEIGNGNLQLSNYYMNSVKFYFTSKSEKERLEMTPEEQGLLKTLGVFEHMVVFHSDFDLAIRNIPKLYEFASGTFLPKYVSALFEQSITPQNCNEIIAVSESLFNQMVELCKTVIDIKKPANKKHYYDGLFFTRDIFYNGIQIGILIRATTGKELIEEASLKISHLTGNIFFSATSPILIPYFILAARVNLQIAKSIQSGTRENNQLGIGPDGNPKKIDYFEIVSKDLKALTLLNNRYKIVQLQNETLLRSMSEVVNASRNQPSNIE
ncbi:predicted protein [Naegleria gruberi]|uniref:Predicted protein n=1 Tax=Naegleria gruberi TaxID=5762 RepID=D2VYS1_NAEGR|nr:uncharacterized protein NAEGRDRAFT_53324 [Naegleria gruberi]EFC38004.1 predicted protein [Naegleria gruberi]|eukprot:XP_002670748.1 predicted protein [Naegleria gruberi strain NEG-M]